MTVSQQLTRLIEIELSLEELGGDSRAAVSFSISIEEIFGVSLAADSILNPTGCLANWAKEIEVLQDDTGSRPTFDWIHAARACAPVADQQRIVLLAGANGGNEEACLLNACPL